MNETGYVVTLLNRCIPFNDSPGNIDLQALAQGEGAKLNLVLMGGTTEVSADGRGIDEMFGSIAFGQDPVVGDSGCERPLDRFGDRRRFAGNRQEGRHHMGCNGAS